MQSYGNLHVQQSEPSRESLLLMIIMIIYSHAMSHCRLNQMHIKIALINDPLIGRTLMSRGFVYNFIVVCDDTAMSTLVL